MLKYIIFAVRVLFSGTSDILVSSFYRGYYDTEHNLLLEPESIDSIRHEVLKLA